MKPIRSLMLAFALMALILAGSFLFSQSLVAGPPMGELAIQASPQVVTGGAWNSGWVGVVRGTCQEFTHSLGGIAGDYGVEMWFLDTEENIDLERGIHRENWGGLEAAGHWRGAHWENLDANTIELCRGGQDLTADRISVRVWQMTATTGYDSGWLDIDAGPANALTLDHNLGVPALDLAVSLWFSGTEKGIHQYAYGGLEDSTDGYSIQGGWWDSLTDTTIKVTRGHQDDYVEQVRVIVDQPEDPDYDSYEASGDWTNLGHFDPVTFTHNLHWPTRLLVVRAECNSPGLGIHHLDAGGTSYGFGLGWYGAFVHNLTRYDVQVTRLINDGVCPQVRVRVWKRGALAFLPFVVREK